ncbi:MAG: hypothetical protein KBT05_00250 [Bacteroidales bacterium]|nr:hypothetical protein [Candidatus Cryptobacteroides caccocaballi]
MKAIIIIFACIILAFVLRVLEVLTSKPMKSVGARANRKSKTVATIDLNDPESIKQALAHYKDLDD